MSTDDVGNLGPKPHAAADRGADRSALALRERFLLLRSVATFEGLDDEGLILLAEHARRRAYRRGDVVSVEGEVTTAVRIVISGQLTLRRGSRAPSVLTRGEAFGLLPLVAETTSDHVVADEACVVLELPGSGVRAAFEENFSLLRSSLRAFSRRLSRNRRHLPADPENPPPVVEGPYFEEPRTLVAQLIELRKGPFVLMNVDALIDLARRMEEVRVPAGHVFWSAGERATFALHIAHGRVLCTAPDGQRVTIGCDYTLGVAEAWGEEPRAYEARAETTMIAYRIAYEDFLLITEMHVSVGLDMLRGFTRQMIG